MLAAEGMIVESERTVEEVEEKAEEIVGGRDLAAVVVRGIDGTSAGGHILETGTVAGTKAGDGEIGIVGE